MALRVDTRQIIHALSDTLDLVGVDDVQHGKRIAFMAMQCGKALYYDLTWGKKVKNRSSARK